MSRKKNKQQKKLEKKAKGKKHSEPLLTFWTKRRIKATLMFLLAVIIGLSFWERAGKAGQIFMKSGRFLIGETVFIVPLLFVLAGLIFLKPKQKGKILPIFLGIFILIFGISGILATQNLIQRQGGYLGYLVAKLFVNFFGSLVANIIFGAVIIIGLFIFSQFLRQEKSPEEKEKEKPSLIAQALKRTITPLLKVKETPHLHIGVEGKSEKIKEVKPRISLFEEKHPPVGGPKKGKPSEIKGKYLLPPINLLAENEGNPTSGNIEQNSAIIGKTLDNFGIPVEMSEVNVGPTVTQYAFKPAEGVKLSKITTLSNNLALALSAHPIRIEAPIPGRPLVGIEVPNKVRSFVCLRNLISDPIFQKSSSALLSCLGRDVSGSPMYADLGEMPHLLVAGSTGTGKTIFLSSLILSLLYRNSPENLKLILIDPKRVEFQIYNNLPHLLCPVIYNAPKAINALQWLIGEMERRFELFSNIPTRNILTYNKMKSVISSGTTVPYIVLVIDELADLMAAKGREMEAGVVRLAQMARATGIHLVVATQRPSVEVITGLIKANITSRVTFQVASQVDSRTVLDMAGAEKLLGLGDMLFISSKTARPKRIQGVYVSEKEVKKVASFIKEEGKLEEVSSILSQDLKDSLEESGEKIQTFSAGEDPLYEEAKRIVIEAQKASSSLLQRRLRIGYARAARLIDILEERGIVGPADGAKPRQIYMETEKEEESEEVENSEGEEGWEKV